MKHLVAKARRDANAARTRAAQVAVQDVEHVARTILQQRPMLAEFVMGMGHWFFTNHAGAIVEHAHEQRVGERYVYTPHRWVAALWRLIYACDAELRVTGNPMRFTADGPVITDW